MVIAARFVWVFPATYGTGWIRSALARPDRLPPWRIPFMVSFIGIRGVVSLAAALAIPLWVEGGNAVSLPGPHPARDLRPHHHHPGRTGPDASGGDPLARPARASPRPTRASNARPSSRPAARQSAMRASFSSRSPRSAAWARRWWTFFNARHDQRERLIPPDLDEGTAMLRANNDLRLELIAAERDFLYDLLRKGTITDESRRRARARARSGGGLDPGPTRKRDTALALRVAACSGAILSRQEKTRAASATALNRQIHMSNTPSRS